MTTVRELREKCKILNVTGYSKMKKADLIEHINEISIDHKERDEEYKGFRLGIHVFKGNDMAESISNAREKIPLNAIQLFTHGPRNMNKVNHDYERIRNVGKGIHLYVHSSYPTNPWNGKADILKHTIDQFVSSMDIGSKGVVLHIPKIGPAEVAKHTKTLVELLLKRGLLKGQKVILEMKAVKKHDTKSYESPEKINRLIEALKGEGLDHTSVGICIDTAHIYAGEADIYSYEDGVKYCDNLKYPEWIYLIHLNGNVYDVKKRAGDKHAIPFDHEDKVWKGKTYSSSGCRAFVEYAQKKGIDFILEVKDHHTVDDINSFINLIRSF